MAIPLEFRHYASAPFARGTPRDERALLQREDSAMSFGLRLLRNRPHHKLPINKKSGVNMTRNAGLMARSKRLPFVIVPGWTGKTAMFSGLYFRANDFAWSMFANFDCAY